MSGALALPNAKVKNRFLCQAAFLLLLLSKCSYWLNKLKSDRCRHVTVKAFPKLIPTVGKNTTFRYLQQNIPWSTLQRKDFFFNWLLPMELEK